MSSKCYKPKFETFRGSHGRCSVKKGVLENFAKFTGKHLCFSMNFAKFLRTAFFTEQLQTTASENYFSEEAVNNIFKVSNEIVHQNTEIFLVFL